MRLKSNAYLDTSDANDGDNLWSVHVQVSCWRKKADEVKKFWMT